MMTLLNTYGNAPTPDAFSVALVVLSGAILPVLKAEYHQLKAEDREKHSSSPKGPHLLYYSTFTPPRPWPHRSRVV